jgi:hypothetical protein
LGSYPHTSFSIIFVVRDMQHQEHGKESPNFKTTRTSKLKGGLLPGKKIKCVFQF